MKIGDDSNDFQLKRKTVFFKVHCFIYVYCRCCLHREMRFHVHHLILITSARYASVDTATLPVPFGTATLPIPFGTATLPVPFGTATLPIPSIQLPTCRPVCCRHCCCRCRRPRASRTILKIIKNVPVFLTIKNIPSFFKNTQKRPCFFNNQKHSLVF
ncbi:hypothetical protein MmiAt1_10940 [Methanimicrococcus sp. At1]|uniref:Uncharacterized protein n=1 Tax=Methanimicrococcus hacksteinii TaxID=3028293 RepID=A0ABU3VQ54_9EURY|nr:hypothetical protein [Methanimicrococcus sp. At1]